jgi:RNA polymerase sigma factor (sigma-70 family)
MSDTDILELIKQGKDQRAFAKLYTHFPKVAKLVRDNNGMKDDARDVFQDALIIFHRKARSADFVLTSSISTYLFSVCRNLWREELRRRNRSLSKWEVEDVPEVAADLPALLAREGEFSLAEKALRTLGEKCIDVLQRFYIAHEPLMDIAQALGFAGEGAAKTRKYKCLEEARKRFRELAKMSSAGTSGSADHMDHQHMNA